MNDKLFNVMMLVILAVIGLCFLYTNQRLISLVGEGTYSVRASRAETSWEAPPLQHSIMTYRGNGESVAQWARTHISEFSEFRREMEPR